MDGNSGELEGFRLLYDFSRVLLSGDDPETLLHRLVKATRMVTRADEVILFLIKGGEPVVHSVARDRPGPRDEETPEYSATLVREVVGRGEPLLLTDLHEDPQFGESKSIRLLNITSAMGTPLFIDGELAGIIYASRKRLAGNFTNQNRELMTVVASQAGLLIARALANQALRESEARHRALVEMAPSALVVLGTRRVLFANKAAGELWRLEREQDLIGRSWVELFQRWRSRPLIEALIQQVAFDSLEGWADREGEGDRGVPVEVRGRPVRFGGETAMQLMIHEIGEQKAILARRVRRDRLVAMGTIATTVGHEINNPLAYLSANIEFVTAVLDQGRSEVGGPNCIEDASLAELLEGLEAAREGAERIRTIVDSIQSFSRLAEGNNATKIERPLESSLKVARNEFGADVDIQVDIRPVAPVGINATRLGQVFLNILINAAHALNEVPQDEERVKRVEVRSRQEDSVVIVEICDNGPGIDPRVRDQIFEPFVTTKSDQAGTGLGLAICAEIVEEAGGSITVSSEVGKGTCFRISFPMVEEPATESLELFSESEVSEICGRILVFEPDPSLGKSVQRILSDIHDVHHVSSVHDAVELLRRDEDFDVILSDMRIGGGPGRDFFDWVREEAPTKWEKMVAMTASYGTKRERDFLDELPNPWLTKPFVIRRLRSVIAGVLRGKAEVRSEGR